MAQNADATCRAIAHYIGRKLDLETRFVDGLPWQQRELMLDRGEIQLCWICGLPYVWKTETGESPLELCVVPVMRHARYGNSPVYFSDVIVHRDSLFETFDDLRGASWAYNERRSHSGYNVVRHHLAQLGEKSGYFGRVIESGAHQASLAMVLRGEIDASAIDSTVLEAELHRLPGLMPELRVIETLGPSPMPPWVILRSVPVQLRTAIAHVLLEMHNDPAGPGILGQWGISRFAAVDDAFYAPIQEMARTAEQARLSA
jgi:phosphonate transport system substrate-binding protein